MALRAPCCGAALIDDAMIVAAAQLANVKLLYSEDMQDGLVVEGGVTVRNPFAE